MKKIFNELKLGLAVLLIGTPLSTLFFILFGGF